VKMRAFVLRKSIGISVPTNSHIRRSFGSKRVVHGLQMQARMVQGA